MRAYPAGMDALVSTAWLAEHLGAPDLTIVDASWHMPASNRDGRAEFAAAHIPGAVFFDIEALSDRANPTPHMLPAADAFGAAMEQLGVGSDDRIIIYDNSPLRTSARAWFMLRHFGAARVAILDGGLAKWRNEERALEHGEVRLRSARFAPVERAGEVADKAELLADGRPAVLDARGRPRFEGGEPDPRPGVAAGHIPGSRNLPFAALYRDDGTFRTAQEIASLFTQAGVDPAAPFIASCGSGVTANSLIFAAHLLGNDTARLYDGSWSEWGADPATPKATGPA
jgi:thiosulfate/3-mercaptopyruvate sulfurtransferase